MRIHDPKGGRVRILDCFLDRVCFLLTPLQVLKIRGLQSNVSSNQVKHALLKLHKQAASYP
jgi:hypothetical protein